MVIIIFVSYVGIQFTGFMYRLLRYMLSVCIRVAFTFVSCVGILVVGVSVSRVGIRVVSMYVSCVGI